MNKLIALLVALVASCGLYPTQGTVTEVDYQTDTVTFSTATGMLYSFRGTEDWEPGDRLAAIMFDNYTETIEDDAIITARYCGR